MDNETQQIGGNESNVEFNEFVPQLSGNYNRNLDKAFIANAEAGSKEQAMGIKEPDITKNISTPKFYTIAEFAQPAICGYGYVTAAGAKDTNYFFFSQNWGVSKTATGVYQVTHNIETTDYFVVLTAIDTAARIINLNAVTKNSFDVKIYDAAGVATNTDFSFIVYLKI